MIERLARNRRVIPKWHSARHTARRAEGESLPARHPSEHPGVHIDVEARIRDWQQHRHHIFASDLVSAAIPAGTVSEAEEAAEFLVGSPHASTLARTIAQRFLEGPNVRLDAPVSSEGELDRTIIGRRIHGVRKRLGDEPANPLLWAELSRQYALRGQPDRSQGAMERAIALAPDNRYVLRCAARLWVHLDDPGHAHSLLAKSARTRRDPWLAAAEIAVASVAGRTSDLVREAHTLLERGVPARHATELASSLATLELEAGGAKRARQLFRASLIEPNDNALAQAEWASSQLRIDGLEETLDTALESYEAKALDAAADFRSEDALRSGWLWLADEPYSSEPAIFGSYEASKAANFEIGARFAERGLIANPQSVILLNNLAFCYAKLDRVDDAGELLVRINRIEAGRPENPTVTATKGLIAFRRGHAEEGRARYMDAIKTAESPEKKFIALVMLAVEELRLGSAAAEHTAKLVANSPAREAKEPQGWLRHLEGSIAADKAAEPPKLGSSALARRD